MAEFGDEVMGCCNKCGYHGVCKVLANGVLGHTRSDGKLCRYSAAPMVRTGNAEAVEQLWNRCMSQAAEAGAEGRYLRGVDLFKKDVVHLLNQVEQRARLRAVTPFQN